MEETYLQTMLSHVGYSSFKRLEVFCNEKECELFRKMFPIHGTFLGAHKNKLYELICS
jgi:hypothetical protein